MKNFVTMYKTEEEQIEQIKKWIKENGIQIIVGVVIGLSMIWGWDFYKDYKYSQASQARYYYLNLVSNAKDTQSFEKLQNEYSDNSYNEQAILLMARHAIDNKNFTKALEYITPLTNSEDKFIANIAKLRVANLQMQMQNYDKALSALTTTDDVFNGLYNNTKGDIYLAKNDIKSAKEHYQLAIKQISPNSGLSNIIKIKLNDLN